MTPHEKAIRAAIEVPDVYGTELKVRAYLATMEAEGFVLVLKEPTEGMITAGMAEAGVDLASELQGAIAATPRVPGVES